MPKHTPSRHQRREKHGSGNLTLKCVRMNPSISFCPFGYSTLTSFSIQPEDGNDDIFNQFRAVFNKSWKIRSRAVGDKWPGITLFEGQG
jgi:hypothetical protein